MQWLSLILPLVGKLIDKLPAMIAACRRNRKNSKK